MYQYRIILLILALLAAGQVSAAPLPPVVVIRPLADGAWEATIVNQVAVARLELRRYPPGAAAFDYLATFSGPMRAGDGRKTTIAAPTFLAGAQYTVTEVFADGSSATFGPYRAREHRVALPLLR